MAPSPIRAWRLPAPTGLDALRLETIAAPAAARGEVVLAVDYAALNPADAYLATAQYPAKPSWPHILGRDGIGRVVAVGDGVAGLRPGDVRMILRCDVGVDRPGTLAEQVAVSAESLVAPPAGWSAEQAAGAALTYLTAWQALTMWAPEAFGVVLVSGASGGVGVAAVQLARTMGAEVVALTRSPAKVRRLEELGAQHVVVCDQATGWSRAVLDRLEGRRVGLAIDNIGGPGFADVIRTLGPEGRVSVVGQLAGPIPSFATATLFFRRLRIGGVLVSAFGADQARSAWREIVARLDRAGARPVVDSVFPFERVPEAFERLAAGPMGKVLVRVGADAPPASSAGFSPAS